MNTNQVIGQNLARRRKTQGVSQKALGALLSRPVSMQQIQKYETGQNRISVSTLIQFTRILDCSLYAFLKGIEGIPEDVHSQLWVLHEELRAAKQHICVLESAIASAYALTDYAQEASQ